MSFDKVKFSYPGLMPVGSPKQASSVKLNDDGSCNILIHSQTMDPGVVTTFGWRDSGDWEDDAQWVDELNGVVIVHINDVIITMAGVRGADLYVAGGTQVVREPAVVDLDSPQFFVDSSAEPITYNGTTLKLADIPSEGSDVHNYFLRLPAGFFNPGTSRLFVTVNGVVRALTLNRTILKSFEGY